MKALKFQFRCETSIQFLNFSFETVYDSPCIQTRKEKLWCQISSFWKVRVSHINWNCWKKNKSSSINSIISEALQFQISCWAYPIAKISSLKLPRTKLRHQNGYFWKVWIWHVIKTIEKTSSYYEPFSFNLTVEHIQVFKFCLLNCSSLSMQTD